MSPLASALHALWCHGIIRARIANPVYASLCALAYASRTNILDDGRCDYALTDEGRAAAAMGFERNQL